jgi:hypothetical protein
MKFDPSFFDPKTPTRKGFVRIGGPNDGGYVLVDDLDGISHVFSIGVGSDVSFDWDMAERGANVHLFDGTIYCPPQNHANFHFIPSNWDEDSIRVSSFGVHGNDTILKFDTEGAEWDCLPKIDPDDLLPFRQIVCELHDVDKKYNPEALARLTVHHELVHVHGCNFAGVFRYLGRPWPQVIECTFLRKDRDSFIDALPILPRAQDSPCNPYADEIPIPIFRKY